tara:strand:+ start:1156 stop:1614 length:459 start_codon:yes stop_codon:yes gene_type:complete
VESRKYHLQKQIIEALKEKDNDLYALLKAQWAHRYGVESLEELNNLDFNQVNQNLTKEDNQHIEKSEDDPSDYEEVVPMKEDNDVLDNKQEETFKDNQKKLELNEVSSAKFDAINLNNKNLDLSNKSIPQVKPLIPIPPKPKYGYLKKWIMR